MRPADFDIHQVIDALSGTCGNDVEGMSAELYPGMTEDDLTRDDYNAVDNQIFLCENCGWWCDTSEANEHPEGIGDVCDDCKQELDPDSEDE